MHKEHNIEWITNLRVLATIFVIVVHVSMESRYNGVLYADLIYGGFARFCVPVFVMISGALLLPREVPLIPLMTLCCLVISFVCVWIVNKLPFGKYVSG